MVVHPARFVIGQNLFPPQRFPYKIPVLRVHRGGRQVLHRLLIGIADPAHRHIGRGDVTLQPIPGDVDSPLECAVPGRELRKIRYFLLIQLVIPLLQPLLIRDIHQNAVKMLLSVLLRKELGLDGNPLDAAVLTDQTILIVDGISIFQLLL